MNSCLAFPSRLGKRISDLIRAIFGGIKKRDFLDETEMPSRYYFSLFKNSDLKNCVFYLNGAKFMGYEEKGKVPLSNGGPISFSSHPLNFEPFK